MKLIYLMKVLNSIELHNIKIKDMLKIRFQCVLLLFERFVCRFSKENNPNIINVFHILFYIKGNPLLNLKNVYKKAKLRI